MSVGRPPTKTGFGVGRNALPPCESAGAGPRLKRKTLSSFSVRIAMCASLSAVPGSMATPAGAKRRESVRASVSGIVISPRSGCSRSSKRTSTAVSITSSRRSPPGRCILGVKVMRLGYPPARLGRVRDWGVGLPAGSRSMKTSSLGLVMKLPCVPSPA
jgi:hypothetical protein